MNRVTWYLRGVPLMGRLLWELLAYDLDRPYPSVELREDITRYRSQRP